MPIAVYHRLVPKTVWNATRRWMGNLVPIFIWSVPAGFGIGQTFHSREPIGTGLLWLVTATVAGWLGVNYFGLYQNGRMRRRLLAILGKSGDLPPQRYFVGFATPSFSGILDAHEDVGYLCLTSDNLIFVSDSRTAVVSKQEYRTAAFKPNIHTIIGLGRWLEIEAERSGKPIRMLIEPREKDTMLGNLLYSKKLLQAINEWYSK